MTPSASTILHAVCGAPRVADCVDIDAPGCWHCGASLRRGMPVDDWQGALFVGQNRVRGRQDWTTICEPCVWVMSRAPGVVPGKPPTHNWRLYTVLVQGSEVWLGNKANKPAILAWLRAPKQAPWFAAIADSGQKHAVPYAPLNLSAVGRVQFEEDTVAWTSELDAVTTTTAALLTAGATKDSIESGAYSPGEWQRCGAEAIKAYETTARKWRGGAPFRLALWLAQRDEDAVAVRMAAEKEMRGGNGRRSNDGDVARDDSDGAARRPKRVPQSWGKSAQTLGSDSRQDACSGEDKWKRGGVAHVDVPIAPARGDEQLGLFAPGGVARPRR